MKDWKEEFKRDFYGHPGNTSEIISYIESLLTQQKEDLIKKLEGEKLLGIAKYGNMPAPHDTTYKRGHNQAVDRAIEIIKEEE